MSPQNAAATQVCRDFCGRCSLGGRFFRAVLHQNLEDQHVTLARPTYINYIDINECQVDFFGTLTTPHSLHHEEPWEPWEYNRYQPTKIEAGQR